MLCNFQYRLYVGFFFSLLFDFLLIPVCDIIIHVLFILAWVFIINFLVLITPLYISIHCDAITLLIIAAGPIVLFCCLFCLRFLLDWYNFTTSFILFYPFIFLAWPFGHSAIGLLARFRFIFLNFPSTLVSWCGVCSTFHPFQIRGSFPFRLLPFLVRFPGVVGDCVEPLIK